MVKLKLGYAVLSTADISYFCRLVKGEEYYDCLEISQGITWGSRDPTLKRALYYIVHNVLEEMDTYKEFQFGNGGEPVISTLVTDVSKESEASDLKCTPAEALHLEKTPFATGGWSGNVTRGRIGGQPVAVKLAPMGTKRGKALVVEATAYMELEHLWRQHLPKLIAHGTTANGGVVYIATELIKGSAIGLKPLTQAVVTAARSALRAIHNSGWVHGDIREDNILVVKGSVRFIDFGFAKRITSTAECDKEVKELEEILKNVDRWNVHMKDAN